MIEDGSFTQKKNELTSLREGEPSYCCSVGRIESPEARLRWTVIKDDCCRPRRDDHGWTTMGVRRDAMRVVLTKSALQRCEFSTDRS